MCITASVGAHGANHFDDVMVIQCALTYVWPGVPYRAAPITGRCDPATIDAIKDFQTRVQNAAKPDGQISAVRGGSLDRLWLEVEPEYNPINLKGIMTRTSFKVLDRYYKHLETAMLTRGITTPLRQAHFLAQLGHESGGFRYTEELASGSAYEGRTDLGNTQKGDGVRFKGRGLIQITGRANYTAYGDAIGMDLTTGGNWTKLSTDPFLAVDCAGWYWETRGLNDLADQDDVQKITRKINGGVNGLKDRKAYLSRAKWFLVYP
ncbi:glycoside hydrolase family 19 protein [uncultured Alsobacter sp.]|uniref:glycoside hydrolase family 19 protein n=1 Tax=uncultured Alsobacter sp. TaxID=1748258 RepID=UPI0025E675B2|nr:glycoside hydrolase family 19 protein [uncultured Alsobacter sp.]